VSLSLKTRIAASISLIALIGLLAYVPFRVIQSNGTNTLEREKISGWIFSPPKSEYKLARTELDCEILIVRLGIWAAVSVLLGVVFVDPPSRSRSKDPLPEQESEATLEEIQRSSIARWRRSKVLVESASGSPPQDVLPREIKSAYTFYSEPPVPQTPQWEHERRVSKNSFLYLFMPLSAVSSFAIAKEVEPTQPSSTLDMLALLVPTFGIMIVQIPAAMFASACLSAFVTWFRFRPTGTSSLEGPVSPRPFPSRKCAILALIVLLIGVSRIDGSIPYLIPLTLAFLPSMLFRI
jgi:hypothetical protein